MDDRVKAYAARGVTNFSLRNRQYRTDFSELDWYVGSQLAWNHQAERRAIAHAMGAAAILATRADRLCCG